MHLTVSKIYAVDPRENWISAAANTLPPGEPRVEPHQLRPEDNYLWWDLDKETYFVECNETLNLAKDQIALIEPEDRFCEPADGMRRSSSAGMSTRWNCC